MASSAGGLLYKYGAAGAVTYAGINVTLCSSLYVGLVTRTLDPIPILRSAATAAAPLGVDLAPWVDTLRRDWETNAVNRYGSALVVTLALGKVLVPVKLSLAGLLTPVVARAMPKRWAAALASLGTTRGPTWFSSAASSARTNNNTPGRRPEPPRTTR